uniref:Ig-like domain-containing protein n=1 Tax=Denticeps clupeoides TaxID=299321 RepID=A0AAY4AUM9_9TELE
ARTRPTVTILSPTRDELTTQPSLLCLANRGFPSDWTLSWMMDGSSRTGASSPGVLEKDGLYSWSSSLTLTAEEWSSTKEVTCQASHSSESPVTARPLCPRPCTFIFIMIHVLTDTIKYHFSPFQHVWTVRSLLCLANRGFPSDWTLSWTVDGSSRTGASSPGVMDKDGLSTVELVPVGSSLHRYSCLTLTPLSARTRPTVTILSPTRDELSTQHSLLCLANRGFPSDWTLSWTVDGSSRTGAFSPGVMEKDGLYSWSKYRKYSHPYIFISKSLMWDNLLTVAFKRNPSE